MGSVAKSMKHCYREQDTPNADPERTPENEHSKASKSTEAMGNLRERLPEKRRKDAVVCVEYMMTTSPEWAQKATPEEQKTFFDRSVEWLEEKYGKDNVIATTIHNDETTPHITAYCVPITKDGRLSAKEMIGDKQKMSSDQTKFAEKVKDLGLKRGIEGSKAKHQTIQKYYTNLNKSMKINALIEPKELEAQKIGSSFFAKKETNEQIAERINQKYFDQISPMQSKALKSDLSDKKLLGIGKTLDDKNKRLEELSTRFKIEDSLTDEQKEAVKEKINSFFKENIFKTAQISFQKEKEKIKDQDLER